jgi:hypothetical protein
MNTKAKLLTGAVTLAVCASTVLAATNASAYPGDNDRQDYRYNQNRNEQLRDRRDNNRYNDRFSDRNDRNDWRNNRRNNYPQTIYGNLPNGYRRVVYRNNVYYTRDNDVYYSYNSSRRAFFVVNFPGISIGF